MSLKLTKTPLNTTKRVYSLNSQAILSSLRFISLQNYMRKSLKNSNILFGGSENKVKEHKCAEFIIEWQYSRGYPVGEVYVDKRHYQPQIRSHCFARFAPPGRPLTQTRHVLQLYQNTENKIQF